MNTRFTKSDLKDGMIVELVDNTRGIVLGERIVFDGSWVRLSALTGDLKCVDYNHLSVKRVYKSKDLCDINKLFDDEYLEIIFEFEEYLTVSEMKARLEELTGKKYKIVRG